MTYAYIVRMCSKKHVSLHIKAGTIVDMQAEYSESTFIHQYFAAGVIKLKNNE